MGDLAAVTLDTENLQPPNFLVRLLKQRRQQRQRRHSHSGKDDQEKPPGAKHRPPPPLCLLTAKGSREIWPSQRRVGPA